VLIRWKGQATTDATWEDVANFRDKFPHFQLEDELIVEGGERCHVRPHLQAPS
jgi:transcriptional regulator GlxA family with amidase domain